MLKVKNVIDWNEASLLCSRIAAVSGRPFVSCNPSIICIYNVMKKLSAFVILWIHRADLTQHILIDYWYLLTCEVSVADLNFLSCQVFFSLNQSCSCFCLLSKQRLSSGLHIMKHLNVLCRLWQSVSSCLATLTTGGHLKMRNAWNQLFFFPQLKSQL